MKFFALTLLFLILGIGAFSSGCLTTNVADSQPSELPALPLTYEKHGLSFIYPDNLEMIESDNSVWNPGSWESGYINLKGKSDNISISWIAMHHKPPDIPTIYQNFRISIQKDPTLSDVKPYLLETYPNKTCGDATLLGHMSFYDKVRENPTNEGIILWYHPSQDRMYFIDLASENDYYSYILPTLGRYQQSFRCRDNMN